MPDKDIKREGTTGYLRCQVSKTLEGGNCDVAGEVEFRDVLLCRGHGRQFEAHDRVGLLRGIVASLELSLRSISLYEDDNFVLLLRAQRAQATRELARAREDLQQAEKNV